MNHFLDNREHRKIEYTISGFYISFNWNDLAVKNFNVWWFVIVIFDRKIVGPENLIKNDDFILKVLG